MLREKKLTPFSKWDKELPRLCVDPRFKGTCCLLRRTHPMP
jgi:hypothetical protein